MLADAQLPLSTYIVLDPIWYHPQWVGVHTLIKSIKKSFRSMPGDPYPSQMTLYSLKLTRLRTINSKEVYKNMDIQRCEK